MGLDIDLQGVRRRDHGRPGYIPLMKNSPNQESHERKLRLRPELGSRIRKFTHV